MTTRAAKPRPPASIDVPSTRGGFVVHELARLVVLWRLPHVQIAPHLEAIVTDALTLAGDDGLAHTRPSGDWHDPMPRPRLMRHVRAIAKQSSNATMHLASFEEDGSSRFDLEYRADLPVWLEGRGRAREGIAVPRRGRASWLRVNFPRAVLYDRPEEVTALLIRMLGHAAFSAGSVGLALDGHHERSYPLGLQHLALDLSDLGCVTTDVGDDLHHVGWLTAVGAGLVARLGGRTTLTLALAGHGEVLDAPGGVVVRLGAQPSRGSTEASLAPYRAFARLLGPMLHVPREVGSFTCGFADGSERYADREDEMQAAWHQRLSLTRAKLRAVFSP